MALLFYLLLYLGSSPRILNNKLVVSAVINELAKSSTEEMRRIRRCYDRDYSIDLTKNCDEINDEFSDWSRPITPAELENCINKLKYNNKSVKGQKSRKGSVVNQKHPKETMMTKWDKRNNESIVGENKTLQTNGKVEINKIT